MGETDDMHLQGFRESVESSKERMTNYIVICLFITFSKLIPGMLEVNREYPLDGTESAESSDL